MVKKKKSEKGKAFVKKLDKVVDSATTLPKKKILKKPKAKIKSISAKKTLSRFAQTSEPLVREVERKEIVRDDRRQFFNREFAEEKKGVNKWLR